VREVVVVADEREVEAGGALLKSGPRSELALALVAPRRVVVGRDEKC